MNQLFCDGGVIRKNPSTIGGTWAFRLLEDGEVIREHAAIVIPAHICLDTVSNNLAEMLALINGMEELPRYWKGTIYSDSMVTLGRAFQGWKWNGIPDAIRERFRLARLRLVYWGTEEISYVLLAGHPTRAQLAAGTGHSGLPVNIHNVWCDKACNMLSEQFLAVPF